VEILSELQIEHEGLFLALCPLCSAKYKELVKRDPREMQKIKRSIIELDSNEIPVRLDVSGTSIRFVETHFMALKAICASDNAE